MSTRINWSDIVNAARQTSEELAGKDWVNAGFKARTLLADLADVLEGTKRERDNLLEACKAVLFKTDLATRWPCPDCDRRGPDDEKRVIELANGNLIGCTLCNTDDLRDLVRAAVAKATSTSARTEDGR